MLGFLYCAHRPHRQQGRLHFQAAEILWPTSLTSGTTLKKFSPILLCQVLGIAVLKHGGGRT
jgi:hypothetical protein